MDKGEEQLSALEVWHYKSSVRTKTLGRCQAYLGLRYAYIALDQEGHIDPRLDNAAARAWRSGLIASEDFLNLYESDIIISADGNRHAVVEVSITADRNDIERAKSRADVLSAVTDGTVTPVVITSRLNPAQSAQATSADVAAFVIPYPSVTFQE